MPVKAGEMNEYHHHLKSSLDRSMYVDIVEIDPDATTIKINDMNMRKYPSKNDMLLHDDSNKQ